MYVDYDAFASMSPLKKNTVLHQLTPENVSEIVISHWRRFLETNRGRLNDEQVAFIEESVAEIKPELYRRDRARTQEEFDREREREARLLRLFSRDDARSLHMEAFNHSGEIQNPLARALMLIGPKHRSDDLDAALADVATLPASDLRQKRPDLPAFLQRYIEVPADFWSHIDDEDVRLAARRGRVFAHTMRNPLALILWQEVARPGEELAPALRQLRDLPVQELPRDLPELLARHYDGVATGDEFWRLAADEDVRVAASKAYVLAKQPWLREKMQQGRHHAC